MAQQLGVEKERASRTHLQSRLGRLRLGIWIELIALFWMVIEACIAITTGFATRSVSLEGFGIDSIIELVAGSILLWRLLVEQRGGSIEVVSLAERRASWITSISLCGLALYIVADSALALVFFIVREGREAIYEARTGEMCACGGNECT